MLITRIRPLTIPPAVLVAQPVQEIWTLYRPLVLARLPLPVLRQVRLPLVQELMQRPAVRLPQAVLTLP